MSFKPYPSYKPSGVEWLGNVPEGWHVERLKFSATSRVSNVDKLSGEDEIPVRLCNYVDVYKNDEITSELPFMEATATSKEINKFGLKVGDVLITKDSEDWRDIAIPAYVRETADDLVCGYHLAIVRASERRIEPRYLFDLFRSRSVNTQFQIASSGVTRYGLPKSAVGEALVPIPPRAEQEKISAFIEMQTCRIDELIAKKRELIDRLKEKRTALISHVVTKGLPPEEAAKHGLPINPPLKPSGIPWLGGIPEHWELMFLKRCVAIPITDGPHLTPNFVNEGVPFLSAEGVYNGRVNLESVRGYISPEDDAEFSKKCKPQKADVLVVKSGSTTGKVGYVSIDDDFNIWSPLALVRASRENFGRFLYYALASDYFFGQVKVSWSFGTQPNIGMNVLQNLKVVCPPLDEQRAIAQFLDQKCELLEAVVKLTSRAIERLLEYRSALITAAVTGKMDLTK